MSPLSIWEEIGEWLAHLPVAFAYRIIWLSARLDLGSARAVYRAMWNANLSLPPLKPKQDTTP